MLCDSGIKMVSRRPAWIAPAYPAGRNPSSSTANENRSARLPETTSVSVKTNVLALALEWPRRDASCVSKVYLPPVLQKKKGCRHGACWAQLMEKDKKSPLWHSRFLCPPSCTPSTALVLGLTCSALPALMLLPSKLQVCCYLTKV